MPSRQSMPEESDEELDDKEEEEDEEEEDELATERTAKRRKIRRDSKEGGMTDGSPEKASEDAGSSAKRSGFDDGMADDDYGPTDLHSDDWSAHVVGDYEPSLPGIATLSRQVPIEDPGQGISSGESSESEGEDKGK
ncbi:hypothetical protein DXG01_016576, partial [Tephrocybe rancida]